MCILERVLHSNAKHLVKVEMSKKILVITICSSVTVAICLFICFLAKQEQYKIHREHRANALSQFHHDRVIQGQLRDLKVISDCMAIEKEACIKQHLPSSECKRRIDAVYQVGMIEEARVRATHYHSPFQPPQTD